MARIQPFRAFRPRPDLAAQIASPPYDVLNSNEAREMAKENHLSFLHVVKPEIDLSPGIDPHDPAVYAKGAENLRKLIDTGHLVREEAPALYVYQQRMGTHTQCGVVAGASIDEYEQDLIKKHEFTRPDKEDDRTRHMDALNANTGPVFLTYPARPEIDRLTGSLRREEPLYDFSGDDGIQHTLWSVTERDQVEELAEAFAGVPYLYVADGHHRSASATRVRAKRRETHPTHSGKEQYNYFLSVIFPHDQMKIMAYNRVVRDLQGKTETELLELISENFEVSATAHPEPDCPHSFGMLLGGRWLRLKARPQSFPSQDPVASLDVAILQENLLGPALGIEDPRTDERIDFVGGIRGIAELERRCHEGWALAFALYPTSIEQLMAVADAGKVMPPKSTWFEPKLRSGLIVRPLDD